jgi:hypothetical protein
LIQKQDKGTRLQLLTGVKKREKGYFEKRQNKKRRKGKRRGKPSLTTTPTPPLTNQSSKTN